MALSTPRWAKWSKLQQVLRSLHQSPVQHLHHLWGERFQTKTTEAKSNGLLWSWRALGGVREWWWSGQASSCGGINGCRSSEHTSRDGGNFHLTSALCLQIIDSALHRRWKHPNVKSIDLPVCRFGANNKSCEKIKQEPPWQFHR